MKTLPLEAPHFVIRPLLRRDLPPLLAELDGQAPSLSMEKALVYAHLGRHDHFGYVAIRRKRETEKGRPAGLVLFRQRRPAVWRMDELVLLPPLDVQTHGNKLLAAVERRAVGARLVDITLDEARRFWIPVLERRGWHAAGQREKGLHWMKRESPVS